MASPSDPEKKKKKGKWYHLNLFKKTKGFDRTEADHIPLAVTEPIAWLKSHNALGEEGIFRIPGSTNKIRELKQRYDKGKKVDLEAEDNIHTVAGLFKVFFRELPEPLLTFELYDAFLVALQASDTKTQIEYIKAVIQSLPPGNRSILKVLMSFLKEVSGHPSNCMNATNLAIVFAPNLIRPKIETIDAILMNSSNVNKLIYMLIFHYEQMFLGKEVDNDEDDDIALSPHLISLKAAQDKVHGSPSSDVPPPTLQTPPQVPADAAKPVQRRKLGQRGRTHTSSASLGEAKPKKKGHTKEKSGEITLDGVPKKKRAPAASNAVPVKSSKKSDKFYSTLKAGTMKLAQTLLEEKELWLEIEEIDKLTGAEREEAEAVIATRLQEEAEKKKSMKKDQRTSRKMLTSAFRSLIIQNDDGSTESDSITADSGKNVKKTKSSNSLLKTSSETSSPTLNRSVSSILPPVSPRADDTTGAALPPPIIIIAPVPPPIDPSLLQALEAEQEDLDLSSSDSGSDSGEDLSSASQSSSSTLPPPPPPLDPVVPVEETGFAAIERNLREKAKVESVVDSVASGDMHRFEEYLNEDMKRLPRVERQKSKKAIMARMSISRADPIIFHPPVAEVDDEDSEDDSGSGSGSEYEDASYLI